jgi:RimJ/RimL family protein N-acetyltransferase
MRAGILIRAIVGSRYVQVHYAVATLGMMVAWEHRRQGIGGRLLDESVRWARERGVHKVNLEVWPHNAAAVALYRSPGFTVEGRLRRHYRRANGELWDAITMGLVLDTQTCSARPAPTDRLAQACTLRRCKRTALR